MHKGHTQLKNKIFDRNNFLAGFSLLELVIVVVIIGILVTFALPQYSTTKERALDKEAKASLALIQAAEKIYKMELGAYYVAGSSIPNINTYLRVDIPTSSLWTYTVYSDRTTASRSGRVWTLTHTDTGGNATCAGTGCPPP